MSVDNFMRTRLRNLLQSKTWLRFIRYRLWWSQANRDQKAVFTIGKKLGFEPLSFGRFRMSDTKSSRTLFILGSGYSVTELGDHDFDEIREHVSVGINVWMAHDFLPDVYSLEPRSPDISMLERKQNLYRAERLNRQEVIAHRPKFLVLRPPAPSLAEQFVSIPDALRERAYMYGRVNLPGVADEIAENELHRFFAKYLREPPFSSVLPDNGASVVRLLFLGLVYRFERIVLVGVDLNRSPYFWYHPDWLEQRPELAKLFPRAVGVPHETREKRQSSSQRRPYDTVDVILWLHNYCQTSGLSQIYSGSSSSTLAEFLPIYPWKLRG